MKKVVLLMSHHGSGSDALYALLDSHPRIQGFQDDSSYDNPVRLVSLTERKHKLSNASRIYMDHLLHNHQYCLRPDPMVRMVFVVREPECSVDYMVNMKILRRQEAKRYYLYRMRRLCELARRNPGSVFLTYSNLREGRGMDLISSHIGLKEALPPLSDLSVPSGKNVLRIQEYESLSESYEKYLFYASKVGSVVVK